MLLLSFVIVFIAFVAYQYSQYQKAITSIPTLRGPKPAPFIGNILQITGLPSIWIRALDWANEYGSIMQIFFFARRFVIIGANEEAAKDLFTSSSYVKGILAKDVEDLLGKTGLLFSDGDMYSRVRKICNGAFNIQHLKLFDAPIQECVEVLAKRLRENKSTEEHVKYVDMDSVFMLATLDVITQTMFSVDIKAVESSEVPEISSAIETYLKETYSQMVNPLRKLNPFINAKRNKSCKFILSFMDDIIDRRIKSQGSNAEVKDLLDLLLDAQDPETGAGLTKEEIRDQVVTFLLAGHETTAHSLAFAVASLAQHPLVAQRAFEEVDEVIKQSPTGKLRYEDAGKLPYLTAVIKETLRMNPVAPAALRQLNENKTIGGFDFPKETIIGVNILALNYNRNVWKNPTVFDPSRFLRSEESIPVSFMAYAPFGHGKRSCIGQHFAMLEMKLMLATLVHQFSFSLPPMVPVSFVQHLTVRPKNGLPVAIWPRN